MDVMRGGDSCWHWSKWYMFTGVFACVWACMAVSMPAHLCVCVICPRGNWLATRHGCCSNDAVTTTVWHLLRINIFHLEWSYYPLLVVAKIKCEKIKNNIMTPAAMIVGIRLYVLPHSLYRIHRQNQIAVYLKCNFFSYFTQGCTPMDTSCPILVLK